MDLLLSANCQHSSNSSQLEVLLRHCVRLLRALAHDNDVIQHRIVDHLEQLLAVRTIHADIALLITDVSLYLFGLRNSEIYYH